MSTLRHSIRAGAGAVLIALAYDAGARLDYWFVIPRGIVTLWPRRINSVTPQASDQGEIPPRIEREEFDALQLS